MNEYGEQTTWLDIQRQERGERPAGFSFYGQFSGTWNSTRVFAMSLQEAVQKLRDHEAMLPQAWGRKLIGVYQPEPVPGKCHKWLASFRMYDLPQY
jgi:hypothetical protein